MGSSVPDRPKRFYVTSFLSFFFLFFFLLESFLFEKRHERNTHYMCVCVKCSDVAGSKAWMQETREARLSFWLATGLREVREKDRKANTLFCYLFFFFLFSVSFLNVLNPLFQFFRRCPLPWHRRLLSPSLCLLLRFRISVLAFGYLKKIQRKNIKRNPSKSRCQISYLICLFSFLFLSFKICFFLPH